MPAKDYRVKIVREGLEFEVAGDKAFVLEMLKRFNIQSSTDSTLSAAAPTDSKRLKKETTLASSSKALSIREFIQQFSFTKHTDITLAFGYYLEKHAGVASFTRAEITNSYYEAKLESSNTSQMIIQNIKRGFMMASRAKGEKGKNRYTLTNSGEKYIDSKMRRKS